MAEDTYAKVKRTKPLFNRPKKQNKTCKAVMTNLQIMQMAIFYR